MQKKKWLFYSLFFIFFLLLTNTFVMYWSDTYSVAHPHRNKFYTEPNTRVLKTAYILENKTKYDSFIFGSSRIGAISPYRITDGIYYNMSYSEGIPHEHLLNIKLFLNNNIKIKNLWIGLDDFSYQVSFEKHQIQGLTKLHPQATGTSLLSFYKDYFFRFPQGEDRRHIKHKMQNSSTFATLNIAQDYNLSLLSKANENAKDFNTTQHLNKAEFNKPTYYSGNTLEETLQDIHEIKSLCKSHNIQCKFFINPIHQTTYKFLDLNLLNNFKDNLEKITDYYDFAYLNAISENNFYWHETSHYRSIVGDMIIDTLTQQEKTKIPFGIYRPHRPL